MTTQKIITYLLLAAIVGFAGFMGWADFQGLDITSYVKGASLVVLLGIVAGVVFLILREKFSSRELIRLILGGAILSFYFGWTAIRGEFQLGALDFILLITGFLLMFPAIKKYSLKEVPSSQKPEVERTFQESERTLFSLRSFFFSLSISAILLLLLFIGFFYFHPGPESPYDQIYTWTWIIAVVLAVVAPPGIYVLRSKKLTRGLIWFFIALIILVLIIYFVVNSSLRL